MKCHFSILSALLLCAPLALHAEDGATTKILLTTTKTVADQTIKVPVHPKVQMLLMTIAPGERLPVHKHPYPRYVYIQKGELDVTLIDQKKVLHFKAGDCFAEAIDEWHFGTNNGKEPLEMLVVDQMPQGVADNTELQHKH